MDKLWNQPLLVYRRKPVSNVKTSAIWFFRFLSASNWPLNNSISVLAFSRSEIFSLSCEAVLLSGRPESRELHSRSVSDKIIEFAEIPILFSNRSDLYSDFSWFIRVIKQVVFKEKELFSTTMNSRLARSFQLLKSMWSCISRYHKNSWKFFFIEYTCRDWSCIELSSRIIKRAQKGESRLLQGRFNDFGEKSKSKKFVLCSAHHMFRIYSLFAHKYQSLPLREERKHFRLSTRNYGLAN